ncbi:SCO2521 family protein [Microtetraspora malaysiensis]|uniref:SCO2521 family protein n=1 Tax=Microtetraspora malaysiensis TaxID=161358 RepID=UPI003D92F1EB
MIGAHMLVMGEVRTGLLQNSGEIPESLCQGVLGLLSGERVRISRRPIVYAVSPDQLTGVDCRLASASRARVRGVGTVLSRASVTGGRVLQGSSHIQVARAESDHRLSWSHYLARPGVIEVFGKVRVPDLADGFADSGGWNDCLDLGSVGERFMDVVQASPLLDRKAPFRSARTRLRWVAVAEEPGRESPDIRFTLGRDRVRTLRLVLPDGFTPDVVDFCEDLALHDWLLTTLLVIVERARVGTATRAEVTAKLAPAVDHLLHLWMPAARLDDDFAPLWEALERRPGFTRQWQSLVARVRDQVAINTLALLREAGGW